MSIANQFGRDGYAIVRSVLDETEVQSARALCRRYLARTGQQEMLTSHFLATEFLAGIALRERLLNAVRELIGVRVALYANCTARRNVYVPWHVDSTFVGPDHEYVWAPDFAHVQAGLYLQDNSSVHGGGIDVVRCSHLISFDAYGTTSARYDVAARTLGVSQLRTTVDTKAGDVVLWHGRLLHASTAMHQVVDREKYGIFFSFGRHDLGDNQRFLSHIQRDSVRTMGGVSAPIPRLAEIAGLRFPDSFPEWFIKRAAAAEVEIPTLRT